MCDFSFAATLPLTHIGPMQGHVGSQQAHCTMCMWLPKILSSPRPTCRKCQSSARWTLQTPRVASPAQLGSLHPGLSLTSPLSVLAQDSQSAGCMATGQLQGEDCCALLYQQHDALSLLYGSWAPARRGLSCPAVSAVGC